MKPLQEQIVEIEKLMLIEKIIGDAKGNIARVDLNRGCPSAVRERLQIAGDTAKMNEKNLRAREEALKGEIATATGAGDAARAAKLQAEMDRIGTERTTNLKNMDRLESIASDYALKYKPKDDLYDQRGHALFLQREQEKLAERMKHEEGAPVPNGENMDKIKRRMARIQTAQAESQKWLSEKDPKWLKAQESSKGEDKEVLKREKDKMTAERKAFETAKKEAEKAQAEQTPEQQATAERQAAQAGSPEDQKAASGGRGPGAVWQTSNGQYGAINRGGVQKYFGSEEEAKVYAALEKGSRRTGENRKRKTAVSAEVKASSPGTARKKIAKKMEVAKGTPSRETASPGVNPTPPSQGRSRADFGSSSANKGGFGKKASKKSGFGKVNAGDLAAEIVGNHLENLNEIYRDSGLGKRKEKNMEEQKQYTIADYEQGIKDLKALIEKHKKLADEAKAKGDTAAYRKHSGHVSEYYADIRTTKEMIKRAKSQSLGESSMKETVSTIMANSLRRKGE